VTRLTGRRIPWGRIGLLALAIVILAAVMATYYKKTYSELTERTAMDQAQVARNISTGEGFKTRLIRPFNAALLDGDGNYLPELNNAPLYPYFLSALFKFKEPCDQVTSWASLGFLGLTLIATFVFGRVLFNLKTGLTAAAAVGLSAAALRVGTSGAELTVSAFLLTSILVAVALHSRSARRSSLVWAGVAAACAAALYMTDYVFAFAILPLAVYFAASGRFRRGSLVVFLIVSAVLMAPCAYRNAVHTGFAVLGVRAWDVMADTMKFPGDVLYRSTDPALRDPSKALLFAFEEFGSFARKLVHRSGDMASALPSTMGLGVLAFALVSVLYRFKNPAANTVRGLLYGLGPVMIAVLAVYSDGTDCLVIFAPAVAVFASAYLILLVEARKLDPFFARVLVGGFLFVTAIPILPMLIWGSGGDGAYDRRASTSQYFYEAGNRGISSLVYTDAPWVASWRTMSPAVWVPMKDEDVHTLEAKGMTMRVVILTPESESYSPDEIWWLLHKVRLWREYVHDPGKGLEEIMRSVKVRDDQVDLARKYLQRLKRRYAVSTTISGFVPKQQDPLGPDDIQILIHPDLVQ
jgi:hypothetical protein